MSGIGDLVAQAAQGMGAGQVGMMGGAAQALSPQAQIEHLTKVVRVLWHEVERMRTAISVSHNQVTIKLDAASLVMKQDGSITLEGNQIVVKGSGSVSVKASGPLVLKGSTIQQN
jgi:glutamyl-tRNA reductase